MLFGLTKTNDTENIDKKAKKTMNSIERDFQMNKTDHKKVMKNDCKKLHNRPS